MGLVVEFAIIYLFVYYYILLETPLKLLLLLVLLVLLFAANMFSNLTMIIFPFGLIAN